MKNQVQVVQRVMMLRLLDVEVEAESYSLACEVLREQIDDDETFVDADWVPFDTVVLETQFKPRNRKKLIVD